MSSDHHNPLSLEDQCYLYLILHLEKYLPEELSLLSLRARERLLVNLPAADICKLEETTVAEGVDMNGVWKKVGQRQIKYDYDRVCPSTLESLWNRGEGYRDHYHEVVSHGVVWEYCGCKLKVPLLLYTSMKCLGISNWQTRNLKAASNDEYYYTPQDVVNAILPPRYEQYFTKDGYNVKSRALMLFSSFKMLPRKLTTGFFKSQYACEDKTMLRLLLSKVEEFHIQSDGLSSETLCGLLRRDTPQLIIPNLLIQCSGSRLNRIDVVLDSRSYDRRVYLGQDKEILPHGNVPQENECLPHSTFIMVKELEVSVDFFILTSSLCLNALLRDIAQAIKYELRLENLVIRVDLDGSTASISKFITELLSALTEFVCRKAFRRLVLHCSLPVLDLELYDKLIAPFSHAPPQQKRQVIEMHFPSITNEEGENRVPVRSLNQTTTALRWRSISISVDEGSFVSESFFKRVQSLDINVES